MQEILNYKDLLSLADWAILLFSLIFTGMVGLYGQKKNTSSHKTVEYMLMGRKLSLPLFVATLTSTWYGNILGVTQISFEQGLYNFITQGFFWYISYFLFAVFLVKKIRRSQAISLPELIKKYFGEESSLLMTIVVLFKSLPVVYAISLGGLICVFFNISLFLAIFLGISFVALYSSFGGLRAIVYSDFVQFCFMITSVILVIFFSYFNFGGLSFLQDNLPKSYFSFSGKHNISYTIAWFFIAVSSTALSPTFYQRCLAAKTDGVAINGIFLSIAVWFIIDICTTLGGMFSKACLPEANSSVAYISYSLQVLPNGCRGLFLAGLLATILSTMDSFLLISANTISYDLFANKTCRYHFTSSLLVSLATFLLAIIFNADVEKIWLTCKGFCSSCISLLLLIQVIKPLFLKKAAALFKAMCNATPKKRST